MKTLIYSFCLGLVLATAAFAGDRTVTLSAAEENLLTWAATNASDPTAVPPIVITEPQVFNRLVNKGLAEIANQRAASQSERLWNKFQALNQSEKKTVLDLIGSLDQ